MARQNMARQSFDVSLRVRAPFLFAALEPAAHGVDASALRSSDQCPIMPGDHLRGHLRHAAAVLFGETSDAMRALFGEGSPDRDASGGVQDEPRRGALIVGDFSALSFDACGKPFPTTPRRMRLGHRVEICEATGAASEGMFATVELAVPYGGVADFRGVVTVRPSGPRGLRPPIDMKRALERLLQLVSHVGAMKSAGYGEIEGFTVAPRVAPTQGAARLPVPDRIEVDLVFDGPLLVAVERQAFNVLVGATIIPGAALKGALAVALDDDGRVSASDHAAQAELSRIRISHAFPLQDALLADRAIPAALACAGGDYRLCFSPQDGAALAVKGAPAFPGDWKSVEWDGARARLRRPESDLVRQARGRVAIGPAGFAEEGKLFVTDLVETAGRVWRVVLDRAGADKDVFAKVVAAFETGFAGLGRTGAALRSSRAASRTEQASPQGGLTTILLETAAAMTDPTSPVDYASQYLAYFRQLLGDGVSGARCVATRRLAGEFYAHRYRAAPSGYLPFELTQPGATFELDLSAEAAAALAPYLTTGLPPRSQDALLTDPAMWRQCPFMPQNGFGEISLLTMSDFKRMSGEERAA
jgi:hypothetical protein